MRKKTINCVEMKHKGAARVQAQIAGMTRREELLFWAKQSKQLADRRRRAIQSAGRVVKVAK